MAASLCFAMSGKALRLLHGGSKEISTAPGTGDSGDAEVMKREGNLGYYFHGSPGDHANRLPAGEFPRAKLSMEGWECMRRILDLTLEVIFLLSGEQDYIVVKKASGEPLTPIGCIRSAGGRGSVMPPPPPSITLNTTNQQKILQAANRIAELLTGEAPVRWQDVAVFLSAEERAFLEENKDLYRGAGMEDQLTFSCLKEEETVLSLFLDIIFMLSGEQLAVVMKTSSEHGSATGSGRVPQRLSRTIAVPPPPRSERRNQRKVLEATNQIIELLTEEVPIRCQDVAVYFSPEERAHIERNKDRYRDAMMEDQPALTSRDGRHIRTATKRSFTLLPGRASLTPNTYPQHRAERSSASEESLTIMHRDGTLSWADDGEACTLETLLATHQRLVRDKEPLECRKGQKEHVLAHQRLVRDKEPLECWKSQKEQVLAHQRLLRDKEPLECRKGQKEHVLAHQRLVRYKEPLECRKSQKEQVLAHQRLVRYKEPLECWKSQKEQVLAHQRLVRDKEPLECRKSQREHVLQYQRLVRDKEPLECRKSQRLLRNQEPLECRPSVADDSEERPCPSSDSGKPLVSEGEVVTLRRADRRRTPCVCLECGKTFTEKSYMLRHLRVHTGARPYFCSECGKCFSRSDSLRLHLIVHMGRYPFTCSECGRGFTWKASLEVHMADHAGARPFLCRECGQNFNNKRQLVLHQADHASGTSFSCSECGKCFLEKSALIIHQHLHIGGVGFSCSECGKHYRRKGELMRHQRKHTGNLPFTCSECGRGFMRKEVLTKHLRTHTGERPFCCPECGKRFSQKFSLTEHVKLHL